MSQRKPRRRQVEMVQRLIGSSATVRDVAIGIVRPPVQKRVFTTVALLALGLLVEVVTIPIIGPFGPVTGLGVVFACYRCFPDAIGLRAVGVTDSTLVLVRFGGWLRRASLVSIVSVDTTVVREIGTRRVGVTVGSEIVRMRQREVLRLGPLHGVVGYGITQT